MRIDDNGDNFVDISIKISSNLMSEVSQDGNKNSLISLVNLPLTVLENVISYLTYIDLVRFSCTCKYVQGLCAYKLNTDLKKLRKIIRKEIIKKDEKISSNLSIKIREKHLKYKYLLQILNTEVSLVLLISRQNLHSLFICSLLGPLIHDIHQILYKIKAKSLQTWTDIKTNKRIIQQKVTNYITRVNDYKNHLPSIGIQITDLLDITLNSKYEIHATYNIKLQTCEIKAKYEIEKMKILSYLPDLSVIRCNDHKLSYTENALVINFFTMMIKIHNYFMIQDQHYQERMKLYQRSDSDDSFSDRMEMDYNNLIVPVWERISLSGEEVQELYKNVYDELNYSGKV